MDDSYRAQNQACVLLAFDEATGSTVVSQRAETAVAAATHSKAFARGPLGIRVSPVEKLVEERRAALEGLLAAVAAPVARARVVAQKAALRFL